MSLQRKTLAEMLTFTRAGTATYFGSDGLLKTAAANEPRFDYDPETLQPRGLLVEGSRTNLLIRSEEFSDAVWAKGAGASITENANVGPSGGTDADLLTISGIDNGIFQIVSVVAGTTYTFSWYAKLGTLSSGDYRFALYNQTSGAFITADIVPAQTPSAVGWTRIRHTFTAPAGCTSVRVYLFRNFSISTGTVQLSSAQLEAGAFPSSYIPTTTAAVTRAADSVVMTGAQFSDWFNASEGTIVVEFSPITNGLTNTGANGFYYVYDVDSAAAPTSNHILAVSAAYGPGVRAQTELAGVNQAAFTSAATLGTGASLRQSYAYKVNDFAGSLNGGTVQTDASGSLPTPNRMAIGSQNGGASGHFDGHIRRIRYWPNRLSNALLQEATA